MSTLKEDPISFKFAAVSILVIVVLLGALLLGAAQFSKLRGEAVTAQYTEETQKFLAQNSGQVENLLIYTMKECERETPVSNDSYAIPNFSCQAAIQKLNSLNKDGIKDSTAMSFLKYGDDGFQFIEMSGQYTQADTFDSAYFLGYQDRDQLREYFTQKSDTPIWIHALSALPQKQVIVPIKQNGGIIGYVIRGVLEK